MNALVLLLFLTALLKPNYTDLVFVGYQGWFSNAISTKHWYHWSRNGGIPSPGNVCFDLYPDISEFPLETLKATNLGLLGNGLTSTLYEANHIQTIQLHLKWMADYQIDGLALQRFVNEIWNHDSETFKFRNGVLEKIISATQTNQRYFYITYDISGARKDYVADDIINDWKYLQATYSLSTVTTYATQNNMPVVGIWGFGFSDRPGTVADANKLHQFFKEQNVYIMGGVPYNWRKQMHNGFNYSIALSMFDIIQPWSVGSFGSAADLSNAYHFELLTGDIKLCKDKNKQYQRVIWPGFSWSNWNNGSYNQIPRMKGDFITEQAKFALTYGDGICSLMIAMFDEFDEGTAIAKAAIDKSKIPVNQKFLTLDADGFNLTSDHYLKVATNITQFYHNYVPKKESNVVLIFVIVVVSIMALLLLYTLLALICLV